MAATQALERLKGLLECSVCLEQYEDPKMLLCTHEFCKVCIESIADFHEDGSAVIKCPMRCAEMTKLSTTQTVGHLAASYNFKNVLEALSDDGGGGNGGCGDGSGKFQVPGCSYVDGCGKPLSVYTSYNVMCSSCYENLSDLQTALDKINSTEHAPINSKVRVPICYNKKENKLMFLCEERNTFCTDVCTEDNALLCLYCRHRNVAHKTHGKTSIQDEMDLVNKTLQIELGIRKRMDAFESLTKNSFQDSRKKLLNVLKERKERLVQKYREHLDKDEIRVIEQFDRRCKDIVDENFTERHNEFSTEELETLLAKPNIDTFYRRD